MGLSVVAVELLECQHSELAVILKKLSNDLGSCCWSATKAPSESITLDAMRRGPFSVGTCGLM